MSKNTNVAGRLLTAAAESAANYLKGIYGPRSLKRIVSAGVIVLSQLSPEQREQAMAAADGVQQESSSNPKSIREVLRKVAATEKQTPGTIIKILSGKDSLLEEFQKAVGSPQVEKKKARGG